MKVILESSCSVCLLCCCKCCLCYSELKYLYFSFFSPPQSHPSPFFSTLFLLFLHFLSHLLFPSLLSPPSPLPASVSEDGEAPLQSDPSHCGRQGGCQEQPLASFALIILSVSPSLSLSFSVYHPFILSSFYFSFFWHMGGW